MKLFQCHCDIKGPSIMLTFIALLLLTALAVPARATVTWYLTDLTGGDAGSTASLSFIYNPGSQTIDSWTLTATDPKFPAPPAGHYLATNSDSSTGPNTYPVNPHVAWIYPASPFAPHNYAAFADITNYPPPNTFPMLQDEYSLVLTSSAAELAPLLAGSQDIHLSSVFFEIIYSIWADNGNQTIQAVAYDGFTGGTLTQVPTQVPEPGILILLGISMASIVGLRRWWKD